jgi:hypothetical protein
MKKLAIMAAGAVALFGAHAASAQTYSPAPGTWTWAGNVTVQKGSGPVLTCRLTVTANVTATSATASASLGLGDIRCLTVSFTGAPYTVTHNAGPPETVTLNNVFVNTSITPGNCAGNVTAVFNDTTNDALVINTSLPQVTSGGACTISGTLLKTAPAGAISIT